MKGEQKKTLLVQQTNLKAALKCTYCTYFIVHKHHSINWETLTC